MALVGRKRGNVEMAREWAQRTLAHADQTRNMFYKAHALGSLAWVHLRDEEPELAQKYAQEAIDLNLLNPLVFMYRGPALAVEVQNKNWEQAVSHAKTFLQPMQQKMPDDVEAMLEQAVNCWEAGDVNATSEKLTSAIELMKQKQMGYV
jgi:hypothetical protein